MSGRGKDDKSPPRPSRKGGRVVIAGVAAFGDSTGRDRIVDPGPPSLEEVVCDLAIVPFAAPNPSYLYQEPNQAGHSRSNHLSRIQITNKGALKEVTRAEVIPLSGAGGEEGEGADDAGS